MLRCLADLPGLCRGGALGCEDIRAGRVDAPVKERIARIARNIQALQVPMEIDHRDTLACVLFDGLSASESFFMEAL